MVIYGWLKVAFGICCLGKTCSGIFCLYKTWVPVFFAWLHDLLNTTWNMEFTNRISSKTWIQQWTCVYVYCNVILFLAIYSFISYLFRSMEDNITEVKVHYPGFTPVMFYFTIYSFPHNLVCSPFRNQIFTTKVREFGPFLIRFQFPSTHASIIVWG